MLKTCSLEMTRESFSMEAMVHGYHVYKDVVALKEELLEEYNGWNKATC